MKKKTSRPRNRPQQPKSRVKTRWQSGRDYFRTILRTLRLTTDGDPKSRKRG